MAKKVSKLLKLQIEATKATPAPPVGTALGPAGINIAEFCKDFNDRTKEQAGYILPVVISVFEDRSYSFIIKTPPAAVLIKKALGLDKGSAEPNKNKVATLSKKQLREIAEKKLPDLNAFDIAKAENIIAGTARSMGVLVEMDQ